MKRHHKVSVEVMDFAAAAYDFHAELFHPLPDHVMRRVTRDRLDAAWEAMSVEERQMLRAWSGTAIERKSCHS